MNIRIVSAVALDLLLEVFVADGNHGAVRSVGAAVDALALLVDLGAISLGADEHDVALVDACVVRAAVGSLFVAPSQTRTAAVVLLPNGVPAQILPIVAEIEQRVPVGLLLACRRRDVAGVGARGREATDAAWVRALLLRPIAHEGVVVCVQLELLGQLLLGHVEPLVVHAGGLVVAVAAQIGGQMVTNVDYLGHVLHLIAKTLRTGTMVDEVEAAAGGPEAADAVGEVLVLRRGAVPLDGVEVELGLVRRATDAPLVDLGRDDAALVGLLLVQWPAHLLIDL